MSGCTDCRVSVVLLKITFFNVFSVLSVLLHYKLLSRDGGRARPHFGERKNLEETYLHLKLLSRTVGA